jgi:hypothetical protein
MAPKPKLYHGKPCKHGHGTVRYVHGNQCRVCALAQMQARRERQRADKLAAEANAAASFDAETDAEYQPELGSVIHPDSLLARLPWEVDV